MSTNKRYNSIDWCLRLKYEKQSYGRRCVLHIVKKEALLKKEKQCIVMGGVTYNTDNFTKNAILVYISRVQSGHCVYRSFITDLFTMEIYGG